MTEQTTRTEPRLSDTVPVANVSLDATQVAADALGATQASPGVGDATQVAPGPLASSLGARAFVKGSLPPPASSIRSTVLPRATTQGSEIVFSLESKTRYEPVKVLGAGGMGEVVLVSDHDIDRKVALKRLLPEMQDDAVLARFVDEIRTVGRLEHPNIVPIHDVGIDEQGRYYFVMKYVEGETLEEIIKKLSAGDATYLKQYGSIEARLELFIGLLHALQYSHSRGIVHRDIKPANVMVGPYGEVVLMDWGIAKPIAQEHDPAALVADADVSEPRSASGARARMFTTRVGSIIGTPAYMCPEQVRGERVDARSDLYSAVVVLHELLTLEHYFASKETLDTMMAAIRTEEIGFMKLLSGKHTPPAELVHVMRKGLEKDPDKRFQSAGELVATLHDILEGKIRVQCHMTFTKRVYRELGRLVDRAPLAGLAVLLCLVAAVVFSLVQIAHVVI